jgi:hypothetical protein
LGARDHAEQSVTLRQLMVGIATWSAVLAVAALIAIAVIDYFFPDLAYALASHITPGQYPIGTPDATTGKFAISKPYTLPGTPPPARSHFEPYPLDEISSSR